MLPKKTRYAIKALMVLYPTFESKRPMRISDIAENEHIPKKFLEAILLDMRKIGIVNSKMGAQGGYYLSKHNEKLYPLVLMELIHSLSNYKQACKLHDEQ